MPLPARIMENLRARSFGIVLAELLLIAAGILIALAVDGWAQDRDERRLEQASLELLRADLLLLDEQLVEFIDYQRRAQRSAASVHRVLVTVERMPRDDRVRSAVVDLTSRRTLRLPRASYAELVGTGNLRLIRDPALRRDIVQFYETVSRDEEIVARNNETFYDDLASNLLFGEGLVYPLPATDPERADAISSVLGDVDARSRELLGDDADRFGGRLWSMPPDHPDWKRATAVTLQALRASIAAEFLALGMQDEAAFLLQRIDEELEDG